MPKRYRSPVPEDLTGQVFLTQCDDAMRALAPDLTARTLGEPRRETSRKADGLRAAEPVRLP